MAGQDFKPARFRMVHGTVQEVENWVNAHWDTYRIVQFAWSVIDNQQMVTIQAISREEAEKQAREQQLMAMRTGPTGPFRPA